MIQTDEEKREAARERFHRWSEFLDLSGSGYHVPAFKRLQKAQDAVREYRRLNNFQGTDGEQTTLAVRVVADTFANQIQAAAGDDQDAATIAWVVAGLRCSSRPFCTGCTSCQTVTAPLRPAEPVRTSPW